MSILGAFNTQLENFSKSLTERFPEDLDMKVASKAVSTLKSVNPKKNIELFRGYVYVYKTMIETKNEEFLINGDIMNGIESCSSELGIDVNKDEAYDIIGRLRNHWCSLDDSEKNNIWTYLQVLIKLTDKYYGS